MPWTTIMMQSRGNDILGINDSQNGDDNLPYATINYANGPGHAVNSVRGHRKNLHSMDMHDQVSNIFHSDTMTH